MQTSTGKTLSPLPEHGYTGLMTKTQKAVALFHLQKAEELTRRMMDPEYGLESEEPSTFAEIWLLLLLVGFAGFLTLILRHVPL